MAPGICVCGSPECVALGEVPTPGFKLGQVIVTEGERTDPISRLVAWATGSWFTHCFIVTGPNELTEAWVPRVRRRRLDERIAQLKREKRAYAVLDLPSLTGQQRCEIARIARSYKGRFYDLGQAVIYGLFRRFYNDGTGTQVCSRHVTAVFERFGINLFDLETVARKISLDHPRIGDILHGFIIPPDLFHSKFTVIRWVSSPTIKTWKPSRK